MSEKRARWLESLKSGAKRSDTVCVEPDTNKLATINEEESPLRMDDASCEELYRTLSSAFEETELPEDTVSKNINICSKSELQIPRSVEDSNYSPAENLDSTIELESQIQCCITGPGTPEAEDIYTISENFANASNSLSPQLENTVSDRQYNQNATEPCSKQITDSFNNIRDPSLNVTAPPSSVFFTEITYSPLSHASYNLNSCINSPFPNVFSDLDSPISSMLTNPKSGPESCDDLDNTPMPSDASDFQDDYFRKKMLKKKFSIKNFMKRTQKTIGRRKPRLFRFNSSSDDSLNELGSIQELNKVHQKRLRKGVKKSNPGKKRSKNEYRWLDEIRKRRCNLGKAYKSRDGKLRPPKTMKSPCKCKLECYVKCPDLLRKNIFSKYWSLGEHVLQWNFIIKYVKKNYKMRYTTGHTTSSRRLFTFKYSLPVGSKVIPVCQVMFLNTLGISKKMVYTALEKDQNDSKIIDNRGKHAKHICVITSAMVENVIRHVNQFKPVESHYIRKDSTRRYLDPELSFKKLFKWYGEWCLDNQIPEFDRANSVRQYRDIINKHMNIGFFIPKKDICDVCHQFKNLQSPSEEQKLKYENHLQAKKVAREIKALEKTESKKYPHVVTVTFDFQKVLSCPYGEISVFYYKRKLGVYNFTLFELGSKTGKCYMWHEATAKRGSNEVASCLYQFIKDQAHKNVIDFRFWSDNCTGQNRNRIVFLMYLHIAKELKIKISHKFMEKGHTQNEGDSVHANIERSAKGKTIYNPEEWYTLVRWCKTNEPSYEVHEVQQSEVYDFKSLLNTKNWVKNTENEKITWTDIKEIFVDYTSAGNDVNEDIIRYKVDLSEDKYKTLNCSTQKLTRATRRTQFTPLRPDEILLPAYNKPLPLPALKVRDLQYLCDNFIIPQRYHNFYNSLEKKTDNNSSDSSED